MPRISHVGVITVPPHRDHMQTARGDCLSGCIHGDDHPGLGTIEGRHIEQQRVELTGSPNRPRQSASASGLAPRPVLAMAMAEGVAAIAADTAPGSANPEEVKSVVSCAGMDSAA